MGDPATLRTTRSRGRELNRAKSNSYSAIRCRRATTLGATGADGDTRRRTAVTVVEPLTTAFNPRREDGDAPT
jgi:hypothetical protein